MIHDDLRELLGAYALDALEGSELNEVTEHLTNCAPCRAEVSEHHEVASLLAVSATDDAVSGAPSEATWERIERNTQISTIIPQERLATLRASRQKSWLRLASVAAVVLLIVAGTLQLRVNRLNNQVDLLAQQVAIGSTRHDLNSVLASAHRSVVFLHTSSGRVGGSVVIATDGTAYFVNDTLRPLDGAHTYQLWTVSHGQVVSLGVLGTHPSITKFHADKPMTTFMVNAEPLGGTSAPTSKVLVQGSLA